MEIIGTIQGYLKRNVNKSFFFKIKNTSVLIEGETFERSLSSKKKKNTKTQKYEGCDRYDE